jgi:urocanate hydratase
MRSANDSDRQLETLRVYGALIDVRDDWGGRLVLCCGEGCAESGTPAAVSIAGGATLVLDADAAAVKSAMRCGALDFVVNTLDEALRALKNEVRLRRPLSVGLIADVEATLQEMVERGVLPDLLLIGVKQNAQAIMQNKSIHALQAGSEARGKMRSISQRRMREN